MSDKHLVYSPNIEPAKVISLESLSLRTVEIDKVRKKLFDDATKTQKELQEILVGKVAKPLVDRLQQSYSYGTKMVKDREFVVRDVSISTFDLHRSGTNIISVYLQMISKHKPWEVVDTYVKASVACEMEFTDEVFAERLKFVDFEREEILSVIRSILDLKDNKHFTKYGVSDFQLTSNNTILGVGVIPTVHSVRREKKKLARAKALKEAIKMLNIKGCSPYKNHTTEELKNLLGLMAIIDV